MKNVIHIGAEKGEIDYYEKIGCINLTYVEPDKICLCKLKNNASQYFKNKKGLQNIKIIPKACSSSGGDKITFYANGNGQSSIEKPQQSMASIIGLSNSIFDEYEVETITLQEVYEQSLKDSGVIDYLCIDTQGHEKNIVCTTPQKFLADNFSIIDVELMTSEDQYKINSSNWKAVVFHLIGSGFVPLINPSGITESYIFLNEKHKKWIENIARPIAESISRKLTSQSFVSEVNRQVNLNSMPHLSSLGGSGFVPLGIIGGGIHYSHIQAFHKEFLERACLITPATFDSAIA